MASTKTLCKKLLYETAMKMMRRSQAFYCGSVVNVEGEHGSGHDFCSDRSGVKDLRIYAPL